MRDDRKILTLQEQRERSRQLYVKTGDKEYLEDMFTLSQMIEIELGKEARLLSWVLFGLLVVALMGPFVGWWFR